MLSDRERKVLDDLAGRLAREDPDLVRTFHTAGGTSRLARRRWCVAGAAVAATFTLLAVLLGLWGLTPLTVGAAVALAWTYRRLRP